jgi:uncharacterized protein
MENVFEISLLMDFYGQLLTDRQYEILDLHYNNDYSLGEIGEQLNISRQGVFDNIKRARITLNGFEEKLGLVKKFSAQKRKAQEILKYINELNIEKMDEDNKESINKIYEGITEIINDI